METLLYRFIENASFKISEIKKYVYFTFYFTNTSCIFVYLVVICMKIYYIGKTTRGNMRNRKKKGVLRPVSVYEILDPLLYEFKVIHSTDILKYRLSLLLYVPLRF